MNCWSATQRCGPAVRGCGSATLGRATSTRSSLTVVELSSAAPRSSSTSWTSAHERWWPATLRGPRPLRCRSPRFCCVLRVRFAGLVLCANGSAFSSRLSLPVIFFFLVHFLCPTFASDRSSPVSFSRSPSSMSFAAFRRSEVAAKPNHSRQQRGGHRHRAVPVIAGRGRGRGGGCVGGGSHLALSSSAVEFPSTGLGGIHGDRDRGQQPRRPARQTRGAARPELRHPARQCHRPARPERERQDHPDAGHRRRAAGQVRHGHRARPARRRGRPAAQDRLPHPGAQRLRRPDRPRERALLRLPLQGSDRGRRRRRRSNRSGSPTPRASSSGTCRAASRPGPRWPAPW